MGYETSLLCPLCGSSMDSLHHRLWVCEGVAEQRAQVALSDVLAMARSRVDDGLFCHGWYKHPADKCPHEQDNDKAMKAERLDDSGRWVMTAATRANCQLRGRIFTDGSCYPSIYADMSRAGWGIVMLSDAGEIVFRVWGPVWLGLPQTAPVAEFCMRWTSGAAAARQHKVCTGRSALREVLDSPNGHSLILLETTIDITAFCCRCGAFASSVPRNLKGRCLGFPGRGGEVTFSRIRSGRHPNQRVAARILRRWPWRQDHPWTEWCTNPELAMPKA